MSLTMNKADKKRRIMNEINESKMREK